MARLALLLLNLKLNFMVLSRPFPRDNKIKITFILKSLGLKFVWFPFILGEFIFMFLSHVEQTF